jgi:hypothetical protein
LARAPGVTQQNQGQTGSGTPSGPSGPPSMPQGPGNAGPGNVGPGNAGPGNQGPMNQGPTGPTNPSNGPSAPPLPPQPSNPSGNPALTATTLNGSWKSSPAPGVTIEATLQPDKHFTWKFTEGGQTKSFSGTYTLQGDNLVLTRDDDGQKMDGTVAMNGDKGFRFRLRNTDPQDPGLDFSK